MMNEGDEDGQSVSTMKSSRYGDDNNRRRYIIAGVCVVLIAVLAIVLGVTLSGRNDDHPNGSSSSQSYPASLSPAVINSPQIPTISPASSPNSSPSAPTFNSSATSPTSVVSPTSASAPVIATPAPTFDAVESAIRKVALNGGKEFENNTYQRSALDWLKTNTTSPLNVSDTQLTQRYALACIYYATYAVPTIGTNQTFGPNVTVPGWNTSTGWISEDLECNWFGIVCDENSQVTDIQLSSNNLTGSFPPEVTLLKKTLVRLNLYDNLVLNVGDEGNAFLGQLTELKYLFYGSTYFAYYGIPTVIGLLTNLREYDCSYCVYYGPLLDASFRNLTKLRYLNLEGNAYNSSVPSSISQLPNLRSLYVGNSFLSGTLDFIKGMPSLFELWLDENPGLTGTIPSEIGNLTELASLSVTNCDLIGPLPSEIGNLVAMEQMWYYGNHLNGTVPSSIGNIDALQVFQIEDNDITGTMPAAICNDFVPAGNLSTLSADCGIGNSSEIQCACCTCCGSNCNQQRVRHRDRT